MFGDTSGPERQAESETGRVEAFSDGVLAVIITIMALELRAPPGDDFHALGARLPALLIYILSFVFIGIYWNNHHHLLRAARRVTGGVMWANLHLLFWLSLIPFATGWMGENHFAPLPTALYGASLLMPALAWQGMQRAIIRTHGRQSLLAQALGRDLKGKLSPLLYAAGIALAFVDTRAAGALYLLVALIWLVPDRRIERLARTRRSG
jgi:TMEM175 potassium channel family protein